MRGRWQVCSPMSAAVKHFRVDADVDAVHEAIMRDGEKPEEKPAKHVRTHWDMLLERRTIADLEALRRELNSRVTQAQNEISKKNIGAKLPDTAHEAPAIPACTGVSVAHRVSQPRLRVKAMA